MTTELIYSYTEGPAIAAKLKDINLTANNLIRMGISFPLEEKYKKTEFRPEENYCSSELLKYLFDLDQIIDNERNFTVRKADLVYGGSVNYINVEEMKGKQSIYKTREPITEKDRIYIKELDEVCEAMIGLNNSVALYKNKDTFLSASIPLNPMKGDFGSGIDVLNIKVPAETLGCRVEFIMPENKFDYKKIETPFDNLANHLSFGKTIEQLEQAHQDFLDLVEQKRERKKLKVVKKVQV